MKRFLTGVFLIAMIAVAGYVAARPITDKGITDLDLFNFLTNIQTIANETKTDFNTLRNDLASSNLAINELRTRLLASGAISIPSTATPSVSATAISATSLDTNNP